MSEKESDNFQKKVSHLIVRNQNILDILTKCQNSCGKICRSKHKFHRNEKERKENSEKQKRRNKIKPRPRCVEIAENKKGYHVFAVPFLRKIHCELSTPRVILSEGRRPKSNP